jgi:indolepyruvate decarboxylase
MNEEYTVGKYLVARLYEVGLRHLFSIPGDYTLDWVDRYVVLRWTPKVGQILAVA